ncbi:hypothetical protein LXM63_04380 [Chryseobacterium gleum]|uniref:hypothetical protein n=1 Tax=Chryseobacterium gleum TaxID=250 RepID=UPI001E3E0E1F|nr:hypothetical protein [Chryseobacterium gleum]MCE4064319.1 hypothetical protein [Chryseobacterium gleum]
MKNSKYIKVSVSEKLPEKEGTYICIFSNNIARSIQYYKEYSFADEFTDCSGIIHWLKEVPDYEDEMKEMLEEVYDYAKKWPLDGLPSEMEDKIESLLTKLES